MLFDATGYLNLVAPSRPNLSLFPKGKNNRRLFRDGFETIPAPTDELNSALEVAKSFLISKTKLPST